MGAVNWVAVAQFVALAVLIAMAWRDARRVGALRAELVRLNKRVRDLELSEQAAVARSRGVGGMGEHQSTTIEDAGSWPGYANVPGPQFPRG